jgi:dTDP-4-amino-4,6-dideoxygalactose transaminase
MIRLFSIPNPGQINLESVDHLLNSSIVTMFENEFKDYVGYKYAVGTSSCTLAIEVVLNMLQDHDNHLVRVIIPSIIPPVVPNAVYRAGISWGWTDNTSWVGGAYTLAETPDYHVVDSAHEVVPIVPEKKYKKEIRLYSFYPTKPVGGIDGGMICTDDPDVADWCRMAVNNGVTQEKKSWERRHFMPGWKGYMSTVQAIVARRAFLALKARKIRLFQIRNIYNEVFGVDNDSEHLYRIDVEKREKLVESLSSYGIETGIHYSAKHTSKAWPGTSHAQNRCSESERRAASTLSIPYNDGLSDSDLDYVIRKVKEICSFLRSTT